MDFNIQNWTEQDYNRLIEHLKNIADPKYREFHSKLVPGKTNILGVRMPLLRKLGSEISKGDTASYYKCCKTQYYEEVTLMGIVIGKEKADCEKLLELTDSFAELIDNWAVCDSFCVGLKRCQKFRDEVFAHITVYLESENNWKKRLGLVLMLDHFMLEEYIDEILARCDKINSDEYYVCMAQAWLLSVAYVKFREKTESYLKSCGLNDFTYKKTVQKIKESRRTDDYPTR